MKAKHLPLFVTARAAALATFVCATIPSARAQAGPNEILKDNNAFDLDTGESWVGGAVPQPWNVAVWDATVTEANTTAFASEVALGGIRIADPGGDVTINGGTFLNLGDPSVAKAIDLSAATRDLTVSSTMNLLTPQEWDIGSGRTATFASPQIRADGLDLTKTGAGTVRIGGTLNTNSLTISAGRVETTISGLITASSGVILGGAEPTTLALTRSQSIPQLVVPSGSNHTSLALAMTSGSVTLNQLVLESPLTVSRASGTPLPAITFAVTSPIAGGANPQDDLLVFTGPTPASQLIWRTQSAVPNHFIGNIRVTGGRLQLMSVTPSANLMIPDASLLSIDSGANLTWVGIGFNETFDGLAGSGTMTASASNTLLTISPSNPANAGRREFSGTFSGTSQVRIAGMDSQILAGGGITYTGATTIGTGRLVLRDATAFGSASVAVNGGTLELESTGGTWTFAKPLSGAGELVKSGPGTVTLTGAAAHTGRTTISGGTLALGATGSLGGTPEIVINGGHFNVSAVAAGYQAVSLLGNGTVTGSVTVANRLAIAKPQDVMNLQNLALAAGATAEFGLAGGGSAAAALGNVSGQLKLNGATLALNQLGTFTPDQKFTLFAYAMGNLAGTFAGLADQAEFTAAGGQWRISYSDPTAGLNGGTGSRFVTVTALPEPGAAFLLAIAAASLLPRRQRRQRRPIPGTPAGNASLPAAAQQGSET